MKYDGGNFPRLGTPEDRIRKKRSKMLHREDFEEEQWTEERIGKESRRSFAKLHGVESPEEYEKQFNEFVKEAESGEKNEE